MFGTLLWPFIIYLVASSSIVDHIFLWLYHLMPGGRKFASLKASSPSSFRSLQTAVRGCRNGSLPPNGGIHSISSLLTIPPLYHYPHPSLPVFTSMGFEVLFLSYLVCALILQHVNIYKTNVHMVDVHLVWFIAIFLSRRVVWNMLSQALASEVLYTVRYFAVIFIKGALLLLLVAGFMLLSWRLIQQNSIPNCLFLCYPLVMYLFTFGFTLDPQGSKVMLKLSPHQELGPLSQLQLLHTTLLHKGVMVNGNAKQELPAPQPCSLPPDAVRYETECLRTDFNLRIKQVLFQSLICAYYVGFIPMKFSEQHYIYYDMWWACQHTLFVWLSSLLMLLMFMLPLTYCDALHKCALHLGGWERYPCGHRDTPHVSCSSLLCVLSTGWLEFSSYWCYISFL
ncbi:transmembrane protein 39A-like isoform X2 [Porites lutea]|uniref:transmembrane protein 39A-like isoform X2 n=1 Tax=Porites lutea TaxID=51062 RepID=UPI003CC6321F